MPTLGNFESAQDASNYIRCKIESLIQVSSEHILPNNKDQSKDEQNQVCSKFIKLFGMPEEEKLVNCINLSSCCLF